MVKRQIQGTDARILYLPSSLIPPTLAALDVRFPRIPLPEPPPTLAASSRLGDLRELLPYMEKGVVLTSTRKGIYGSRLCQGRVFWTGPHTTTLGLHKMERNTESVMLFSKDVFKQREPPVTCPQLAPEHESFITDRLVLGFSELDYFCSNGGELPQCGITLCFGEGLTETDDPSQKLITAQVLVHQHFKTS